MYCRTLAPLALITTLLSSPAHGQIVADDPGLDLRPRRAALVTAKTRLDSLDAARRNVEWFGMNVGGGFLYMGRAETSYSDYAVDVSGIALDLSLLIANINLPNFYITVLELHPTFFLGYLGGGTRLGYRHALSADYGSELRFGTFVGVDFFMFHINAIHPTLSFRPHVQWVKNGKNGSFGVGIDVPISLHFRERMTGGDGYTLPVSPVMIGVIASIRWTYGRSAI